MSGSVRIISILAAALLLVNCGGGGGGGGSSAPTVNTLTISNLAYGPASAYFSAGGTTSITGSINFNDSAGAVTAVRFTSSAGADLTIPVTGLAGRTSGTLQGSFTVSTAAVGNFTFQVWLVDATGLSSNHLTGTLSVSYDKTAFSWTQRTSGTLAGLRRIVWNGTQYVAVGLAGTIVTSTDGITWTPRTSTTSSDLLGIAWSGMQFIAVGANGTILTSPDGVAWTAQISGVSNSLRSVLWAGTQFVAAGSSVNISSDAPILTSPDGVIWTLRASGLLGWDLWNIAWSGARLCVVGGAQFQPASNIVLTSQDGASWAQQTVVIPSSQALFDAIWADSKFVAVGLPGYVATSSDGLTWQPVSSSNLGLLYAITWTGSNFASAGWDIDTSPDGINWTRTVPTTANVWGIVWGIDKYVAVGDGGLIMTSP
jgi:hypothetical protein